MSKTRPWTVYRPSLCNFLVDEGRVIGEELDRAEGLSAILFRLEFSGNLVTAPAVPRKLKEQLHHTRY